MKFPIGGYSPRALYSAGASGTGAGEIPAPTVTVWMKEDVIRINSFAAFYAQRFAFCPRIISGLFSSPQSFPGKGKTMYDKTKKMIILAMLCALAYVVMLVGRIPVVYFLSYDPKDVVIAIGGFMFGPLSAAIISGIVSVIEMFTASGTGFWGMVMNIISSCAFACTAALIYKRNRTLKGAVIGLCTGWLFTTAVMLLWNYLITPIYMGVDREIVVSMLLPGFLPFNLLKGGLNSALTLLLYKPISAALRKARLMPAAKEGSKLRFNWIIAAVAVLIILACIWAIIALRAPING